MSNKHKTNSQKLYLCKECEKTFKVKSTYYLHIKNCNNNNNVICNITNLNLE
jgi:hypothetical protein